MIVGYLDIRYFMDGLIDQPTVENQHRICGCLHTISVACNSTSQIYWMKSSTKFAKNSMTARFLMRSVQYSNYGGRRARGSFDPPCLPHRLDRTLLVASSCLKLKAGGNTCTLRLIKQHHIFNSSCYNYINKTLSEIHHNYELLHRIFHSQPFLVGPAC